MLYNPTTIKAVYFALQKIFICFYLIKEHYNGKI